ncbi:hypothetical protein [Lentzea sp. E54]|uniref:hypothetical protein n=1 Tax=Lentzea xerophila TaxID=3435883 RepID=UPI003DA5E076
MGNMVFSVDVNVPFIGWVDADVWGAWGQWAGAFASFAAAVVAVAIALGDGRRRDRERRDQEMAQARTITAHVEWTSEATERRRMLGWHVVVSNHGDQPITDALVTSVAATMKTAPNFRLSDWRIGRNDQRSYEAGAVIAPFGVKRTETLAFNDNAVNAKLSEMNFKVGIRFTDAHGLKWERDDNGHPRRVLEEAPKTGFLRLFRRRTWRSPGV